MGRYRFLDGYNSYAQKGNLPTIEEHVLTARYSDDAIFK